MRTVTIDQPDPMTDPQFYSGVAPRRGFAWIVDTIAILIASMVLVPLFGVVTLGLGFLFAACVFGGQRWLPDIDHRAVVRDAGHGVLWN